MAQKLEEASEALYEAAMTAAVQSDEGKAKTFTQDELIDLGVVDNKSKLMPLVQSLSDSRLMRFLNLDGRPQFALRTKDVAGRMRNLGRDEIMIYEHIESSGTNGMWSKRIKDRTGIVQTAITKATKVLEGRKLIKPFTNVKNPNQKSYMLSHLDPGEGVKGGPWHSDTEYDMELIGVTADAIIRFIESKSWTKMYIKRERSVSPIADLPESQMGAGQKRRKRSEAEDDIEGIHSKSKRRQSHHTRVETQVPYPPGYQHYPTTESILHFIKESGFIKTSVGLEQKHLQQLLDILVLDERIEKITYGYRTVRGVSGASEAMKNMIFGKPTGGLGEDTDGNGLTQSPCGRCPVFDLCEDSGPINARSCEYFQGWLRT